MTPAQTLVAIHADAETVKNLRESGHHAPFERDFGMNAVPMLGWVGKVDASRLSELRKLIRPLTRKGYRLNLLYLEAGSGERLEPRYDEVKREAA